nr:MAG TPA: hypothetical protein [Caudoviricetes sp.]
MARYVITNSKFKPFSYAELIQPIQLAEVAHQAVEDQYNELSTKANVWENIANEQDSPYTYNMYKTYADDLKYQADQLATSGLTPASRQGLNNMRTRYSQQIVPIEQGYAAKVRDIEAQKQAKLKDNTLMFDREAAFTNLDDYVRNPNLSYTAYSGQTLASQTSQMARNLAKELKEYKKGKPIDAYTNTFLTKYNVSSDDVLYAIEHPNDKRSNKALRAIMDAAVNASPIPSWGDMDTLDRAYQYAGMGLWDAIGEERVTPIENYGARLAARQAAGSSSSATVPRVPWRAIPITRTNEQIRNTTQMKSDAEFLRELASNPSKALDVQKTYYPGVKGRGEPGSADINIAPGDIVTQSYMKRLSDISKKYGINVNFNIGDNGNNSTEGLIKAAEELESRIRKSAIRSTGYALTNTNFDLGSRILAENIRSRSQRANDDTGAFEIEDGKVKSKPSKLEDVIGYINKDAQIEFDPSLGVVLRGSIQDDKTYKTKSFLLDPEVIAGESINVGGRIYNRYQYLIDLINESIENNDVEAATAISTRLMEDLDSYFNSIAKTQGNTMSAKEEEAASYYRN